MPLLTMEEKGSELDGKCCFPYPHRPNLKILFVSSTFEYNTVLIKM